MGIIGPVSCLLLPHFITVVVVSFQNGNSRGSFLFGNTHY